MTGRYDQTDSPYDGAYQACDRLPQDVDRRQQDTTEQEAWRMDRISAEMKICYFLHKVGLGMATTEDVSEAKKHLRIMGVNV